MNSEQDYKLHLGCGQVRLDGFINIDTDPSANADMFLNVLELESKFSRSSVSEVQMYHIINYLSLWDARKFFVILFKICKPGATIIFETVNIYNSINMLLNAQKYFPDYLEALRSFHAFGNDHMEASQNYYPNAFSWTPWHLSAELELAGFNNIKALPPKTHGAERDMRIEATKPHNQLIDKFYNIQQSKEINSDNPSVLFLYDLNLGHSTAQVRGLIHKHLFDKYNWKVDFIEVNNFHRTQIIDHAKNFDIVYLLKVNSLSLVRELKQKTKCKVIFDLTDSLWMPFHIHHGWHDINKILKEVDYLFSENEFVCAYGRKYNLVHSVPVVSHSETFDNLKKHKKRQKLQDKIVIGWIGSTGTVPAIIKIKNQLISVLKEFPNVELRIVGCEDPTLLKDFDGLNISVSGNYDEKLMLEEISNFDIGIFPAPLDEEDYEIRGAQKAIFYMQAGIVAIALPLGDCKQIIKDGENGFLIYSENEWSEKIKLAIQDKELREKIGVKAAESIRAGHEHEHVFKILTDGFKKVAKLP